MVMEIEFPRKLQLAYHAVCRPLCKRLDLPQTAFDILMFFGNNPEYRTARDVVEIRNIKAKPGIGQCGTAGAGGGIWNGIP